MADERIVRGGWIMGRTKAARILVIEDHPAIRLGLRQLISVQMDLVVCGEAGCVAEAMVMLSEVEADLAIVDLQLPDGDGLQFIREIRARSLTLPMIVLSSCSQAVHEPLAIAAGAASFIPKHEASERIIDAIYAVLAAPTSDGHDVID